MTVLVAYATHSGATRTLAETLQDALRAEGLETDLVDLEESPDPAGYEAVVLGSGVREPDPNAPPEAAYRGAPPTRLRLTSSAKFPLVISDDPSTTQTTA